MVDNFVDIENFINRRHVYYCIFMSFFISFFSLAPLGFILYAYSFLTVNFSVQEMLFATFGVSVFLISEHMLRFYRSQLLGFILLSAEEKLSQLTLKKFFSTDGKRSKLQDYDFIKKGNTVFSALLSNNSLACMDIPFIFLYVIAFLIIANWLVVVPVLSAILYYLLYFYYKKIISKSHVGKISFSQNKNKKILPFIENYFAYKLQKNLKNIFLEIIKNNKDKIQLLAKNNLYKFNMSQISSAWAMSTNVLTVIVGIYMIGQEIILPVHLVVGVLLLFRFYLPMLQIYECFSKLRSEFQEVDKMIKAVSNQKDHHNILPAENFYNIQGEIKLKAINFFHEGKVLLNNVNIDIQAGGLVLVIGPSGSGKSLLMKIISGLYVASNGEVFFDGKNISQFSTSLLQDNIRYIGPDSALTFPTINENFQFSKCNSEQKKIEICKKLGISVYFNDGVNYLNVNLAHHFNIVPKSLVVLIKIAIAIIDEVPILIIDGIFNMLDYEIEFLLVNALVEYKKNITIIIASHRFSHMRIADNLLLLRRGIVQYYGHPEKVLDQLKLEGL